MITGEILPKILVNILRAIALVSSLFCIISVLVGIGAVLVGLWGLVWHGQYTGEAFWKFAGLKPTQSMLLNLDKAWWLIAGGLGLFALILEIFGKLIRWLKNGVVETSQSTES